MKSLNSTESPNSNAIVVGTLFLAQTVNIYEQSYQDLNPYSKLELQISETYSMDMTRIEPSNFFENWIDLSAYDVFKNLPSQG